MSELVALTSDELKKKLDSISQTIKNGEETEGLKLEKVKIERLCISKKDIDFPIHMVDCQIEHFDLNSSTFLKKISCRRCEIDTLILSEAVFHENLDFKKAHIKRGKVQRATIKGKAIFSEIRGGHISFHESVFEEKADFNRAWFRGDATFDNTKFQGDGIFSYIHFEGKSSFNNTEWSGKADFRGIECQDDLLLYSSIFHSDLLLKGAVIRLGINLGGSTLEAHTSFSDVSAGRTIDLHGLTVGPKQGFQFRNACAPSIIINRETVEGHVFPENEGKYLLAAKEYGFLRTTFENINRFDDEDWAYYQFKRLQRMGEPFSWNPVKLLRRVGEYLFLDIGCGYGTKPFRTLGVMAILVLLFSTFYFFYFGNDMMHGKYLGTTKWVNNIFHAFEISLIAFSGSYGDLSQKIKGIVKLVAMVEYMIGVVFMGLFVVSFSRKVIR